ncbi:transposase [Saccharopolyspora shandongensis]|uniref:transposase n=1 Tax=Saccharopolyspora shandongensis TaxID=418495 RepID=UPI00343A70BD
MARPSKYPEQFRKDAVELARSSDRPLREVARQLGVNHETLRSRERQLRRRSGPAHDVIMPDVDRPSAESFDLHGRIFGTYNVPDHTYQEPCGQRR